MTQINQIRYLCIEYPNKEPRYELWNKGTAKKYNLSLSNQFLEQGLNIWKEDICFSLVAQDEIGEYCEDNS